VRKAPEGAFAPEGFFAKRSQFSQRNQRSSRWQNHFRISKKGDAFASAVMGKAVALAMGRETSFARHNPTPRLDVTTVPDRGRMVERRPFLTSLAHLVLLGGVLMVALPIWITFVTSTHPPSAVFRAPIPMWPGDQL
jgi:hypothetical protein